MNRQEFMRRLEQLLEGIPEEEKREAIAYYTSYFEDAGEENEEKIIRELESPEKWQQPSGQISQDAIIVRQHLPVISRIITVQARVWDSRIITVQARIWGSRIITERSRGKTIPQEIFCL